MNEEPAAKRASSPTVELLRATSRAKIFKVVQAIDDGAELAVNKHGHNALHIACHKGFLDIVKILISAGCEIDVQDDNGDTALHRACIAGNDLIVRRLIEEGCSVDRQNRLGDSALHEAAIRGYSRCVKALIYGQANIALKNKNSDTAIHLASANTHSGSLRLLLSSYPNSSIPNNQGDTPLHIAVRFGHVTCSRVLLSSNCNVNLQNMMGNTPLHIATVAQHHKLVRILLDAGACPKSIRNNDKKSAIDLAKDSGYGEIAIMLMSGAHQKYNSRGRARHGKRYGTHARRSKSETRLADSHLPTQVVDKGNDARFHVDAVRQKSATLAQRKHPVQRKSKHEGVAKLTKSLSEDLLTMQQRSLTVNPYVVPQLYSLYRDCHGNVQQQAVLDALSNPTAEVVSSLANAVTDTKDELLQEIRKTNGILERRLNELEHNTHFQVAKLDEVTKQRIQAERTRCLHRIERRAMMERAVLSHQNVQCINKRTHDKHDCTDAKLPRCSVVSTVRNANTENDYSSRSVVEQSQGANKVDNLCDLRPYQTVKISRKVAETLQLTNLPSVKRKTVKEPDSFSDSAYSSLCPQLSRKDMVLTHRFPGQNRLQNEHFERVEVEHLLPVRPKPNISELSSNDREIAGQTTKEIFENITHAMEEWYERRLEEVTAKQRRDMDAKVAELENKVKMLELAQSHQPPVT